MFTAGIALPAQAQTLGTVLPPAVEGLAPTEEPEPPAQEPEAPPLEAPPLEAQPEPVFEEPEPTTEEPATAVETAQPAAAEEPTPVLTPEEPQPETAAAEEPPAEVETKQKIDWDGQWYARPVLGMVSFTDNEGESWRPIVLGLTAGRRVWQDKRAPRWTAWYRAEANTLWGPNAKGTELSIGALFGPKVGVFTLRAGPEIFYDDYTYDEGEVVLSAATGVGVPILLTADVFVVRAYYGLQPRFFIDSARDSVDWGAHPADGAGDEFSQSYGVHINLILIQLDVGQTLRYTAYGTHTAWHVGLRFLDL
jgi:hypothetical protein